ncbi:MAG: ComEC/Rec2 family competence protein [Rhizobiaceae bacterium]|nr:ComEC/Rec2 family competence protein [Rhizobiaceae bacterium]
MAVEAGEHLVEDVSPARGLRFAPWRSDGLPPVPIAATSRQRLSLAAAQARFAAAFAIESARGTGLVAFAALFGAGAAAYFALPSEPPPAALAAALVVLSASLIAVGHDLRRAAIVALMALALGAAAGAFEAWRAGTRMIGADITTRLTGRVVAVEEREGGRARLTIDVLKTERPVLRFAPDRVRVTARSVPETLLPGAAVTGVVRLLPATGPVRPDGYDFSFHSYFAGIGGSGFFLTGPFEADAAGLAPPGMGQRLAASVERFRERLADHIRARIGGPEGEIAAALVAGVRGGIAEADNEALRRAGLAHFISISGLHMALVAAIILVTLRSGLALFPLLSSRRPVKKYAAAGALLAISGYIVVSGQEVAAVRSFIMFAVMLVAVLFDRAALTMRNLAISALLILVVAPHEIMGPSFQMSFGATAALIAAYAWNSERRRTAPASRLAETGITWKAARLILLFFGALAATSLVAGLATTVFGIWHFQRVSPLALVANLAAMPVVSLVVMPAAVAGSLLVPLGLDGPFFAAMGWGLRVVMAIAHFLSERSPLDSVGAIPAAALVLLACALAVATIATTATLRLLAVPLAIAGLAAALWRDLPDAFISEDGRLVAVATAEGRLAVSRARPSAFTVSNWQHALAADKVMRPERTAQPQGPVQSEVAAQPQRGTQPQGNGTAAATQAVSAAPSFALQSPSKQPTGKVSVPDRSADAPPRTPPRTGPRRAGTPAEAFRCGPDDTCVAQHEGGAVVVHAPDAAAAIDHCTNAALIVIADATAQNPCPTGFPVLVVTRRDLALRGSAAVWLDGAGAPRIAFAIGEAPRIWHDQRRFSREARGLPPWQRQPPKTRPAEDASNAAEPSQQRRRAAAAANLSSAGSARPDAPAP